MSARYLAEAEVHASARLARAWHGPPIRVSIIDDHPISALGIAMALETASDIKVAGTFADWAKAYGRLPGRPAADVTILDLYLADDVPCLALVSNLSAATRVLVVSASRRTADIEACRAVGARAFVHKGSSADTYVRTVRSVHAGDITFPLSVGPGSEACPYSAGHLDISPRERQVLQLIADGYTHGQVARRLGVSPHTVDTYVKRLRSKLGALNKAQLAHIALIDSRTARRRAGES